MKRSTAYTWLVASLFFFASVHAWTPVPVADDPLVRMPGAQPADGVVLESPNRCLNCHAGYNRAVEPGFNWGGSMMAQAARDPLYWATVVVAAQDAIWAVGNPNGTDICLRCHFPKGWLEGRSDPTNASAMQGDDFDGVQCDFCHRMIDPFAADSFSGHRESNDWLGYWDETNISSTPSQSAADETAAKDRSQLEGLTQFSGTPFLGDDGRPAESGYSENTGGQFFVSADADKRASFADAAARHRMLYSRYHKSRYFCATCHDVSNPVLANLHQADVNPGDGATSLVTESEPAHAYFHVERTFSEFMLSAYGQTDGAEGIGPFAPDQFDTSLPGNRIGRCQDCHMRDVIGLGANKKGVPIRPSNSLEHPKSGQPLHDLTGGNAWMSHILASAIPGSPIHDQTNEALLYNKATTLTMDLTAGQGIDAEALLAGRDRARQQLQLAASIEGLSYDKGSGHINFRIQNQSGHKLISGYPEGRRVFVNIRAYGADGQLLHETNPYDDAAATLKGLVSFIYDDPYPEGDALPVPQGLMSHELYDDALVYEAAMSSGLTGEQKTFHFVLGTSRYKDNRIPPRGFRIADASARMVQPVWHGVVDPGYFTAEEYSGGYDEVTRDIAPGAEYIEVNLYYQTTSREYVQFLADEIDGRATTLQGTGAGGDPPYLVQSDPFFDGLRAWGETMWKLWKHNRDVPGGAPYLMANATAGDAPSSCTAPIPSLLTAIPGHAQVTLGWSDVHAGDPSVQGYTVYYDQSGKAQQVTQTGTVTTYTDSGLSDGQSYCYKVVSRAGSCASGYSNVLCAVPNSQGHAQLDTANMATGIYLTSGKGKNRTVIFTETSEFAPGDDVIIRVQVSDRDTGLPVQNAVVEISVSGPETFVVSSAPSSADGLAEAAWTTQPPNKRGQGGTATGSYTAILDGVTAEGYSWSGGPLMAGFTLQ